MSAIGANVAMQLATTFAQLALVPVLVIYWGATLYGAWLLLFTVPAYIVMADLGLASAAANDMTARVARGDRDGAAENYRAIRIICLFAGVAAACLIALVVIAAPGLLRGLQPATDGQATLIAIVLAGYGGMALQGGAANAGLRATGGYALSGYIGAAALLIEALGAMALVIAGCGPLPVALFYLLARASSILALTVALGRHAPWLTRGRQQTSLYRLRGLVRPAIAILMLPAAQAVSLQGTILVVGAALGSAAVPAFTFVRTLSRVAIQAILIVNHAVMPSMTAAVATEDAPRVARYAAISYATAAILSLAGALALFVGGERLIRFWTHGMIEPTRGLLAVMAVSLVINALWQPASNLIVAINRHEGFSWFYLLAAALGLAAAVPLTRQFGVTGAALALLLVDVAMLWRIVGLSRRLSLLDWPTMRAELTITVRRWIRPI